MASAADPPLSGDINHGAIINGIAWAEAGIVLCLLAARVYARSRVVRSWGSDDWNIVIATVSCFSYIKFVLSLVNWWLSIEIR
jgi:hypothetical protein